MVEDIAMHVELNDLTLEDIDSLVTSLLNRVKEETEVK